MLIELWEKLRGYDKWVQTEAKVESSEVEKTPQTNQYGTQVGYSYSSGDILTWTDASGEKQCATFTVPDDSPLYQLIGGETLTIRYDPASPDHFYFRELLRTRIHTAVKTGLIVILFGGLFLLRLAAVIFRTRR
jgi:hypothetical protein